MNENYQTSESSKNNYQEDRVTQMIDRQTAKVPSSLFLGAAVASIAVSFVLEVLGNTEKSRFIGQWVAPFLLLATYDKLVKHNEQNQMLH